MSNELVNNLIDMGFPKKVSLIALASTGNKGVSEAIDWYESDIGLS